MRPTVIRLIVGGTLGIAFSASLWLPGIVVLLVLPIGIWRHRLIAPLNAEPIIEEPLGAGGAPAVSDPLLAGAKRDFG